MTTTMSTGDQEALKTPVAIYALLDGRGDVHYVGKSVRPKVRLHQHKTKRRWVADLIILEWATEQNWIERERYWITYYRERGLIFNMTDGGEGEAGWKMPECAKAKISTSLRGRKGKPHSHMTRELLAVIGGERYRRDPQLREWLKLGPLAVKGRPRPPAERAKIAAKLKGRVLPPEHREKLRLAHLGKRRPLHSTATKDKIRQALLGKRHTPERNAAVSRALKGKPIGPFTASHCANLRISALRREAARRELKRVKERI